MMEDSSRGNDGNINDAAAPTRIHDLPENHLFRLVCHIETTFVVQRPQIDWNTVTQRLMTPNGELEARQWIDTGLEGVGRQLFLHFVCRHFASPRISAEEEVKEQYLTAAIQAIEAYSDALQFPDSEGEYPLHILCRNPVLRTSWGDITATARGLFKAVLYGNPEAAKLQVGFSGYTALHCFTAQSYYYRSDRDWEAVEMLLEMFPDALRVRRDRDDDLPLHVACRALHLLHVKMLLDAYPRAIQLLSRSKSSLQLCLRQCNRPRDYDVARLLVGACQWMVAYDDEDKSSLERTWNDSEPVGDALDYICHNYCKSLGVWVRGDQYFQANVALLEAGRPGRVAHPFTEATFDMFVHILLTLHGRTNQNLPLHAAVDGFLCRPWNLVVFKAVVSRFGDAAQEADHNGNLPLHLFLKSCMIECDRATARRFVGDGQEYENAVARSLRILLDAHTDAAAKTNGNGRLPLHLAIDHQSLSFETAVAPLLELAPRALLVRDTKTGLYPFMKAAVGANANVDTTYRLLRRDPTALLQTGSSADHSDESRKRQRV